MAFRCKGTGPLSETRPLSGGHRSAAATRGFEPIVLCYHAISDRWQHDLSVQPSTLERQLLRLVRRGYRPARADEVVEGRGRLFHVTFDDAFRSVGAALPVLERLRTPATVFTCTGLADAGRPFPISQPSSQTSDEDTATLDWDGLRELVERSFEIGSHTVSHAHLTGLGDGELRHELRGSRERIESELGRRCRFLAYPYGDHDARVRLAAREAGFDAAFALPGRLNPFDPFAIPRVGVSSRDGLLRFTLKTSPTRHVIERMLAWT